MFKSKLAVVAMAGMLAMCLGLVACGGNTASSSSSASTSSASSSTTASTTSTTTTSASSTVASTDVLYWTGTLADGRSVGYMDDAATTQGALVIANKDLKDGSAWIGAYTVTGDGMVTITDAETKKNINFTIVDVTPKTSMKLDIEGYGEVELKAVTAGEFAAYAEGYSAAVGDAQRFYKQVKKAEKKIYRQIKKLAKALEDYGDNDAVFWSGTLPSGDFVNYFDDQKNSKASLSVIKADYSDGVFAYGKYTKGQDGKITLTDKTTGEKLTYTVTETTPGSAIELSIDGYDIEGQNTVELKAVTKSDIVKFAEEVDKKLAESTSTAKQS